MVGKVVEYPFDTVKVRLQTQPMDQPHYTGAMQCIAKTIRQEGVTGLFKGMSLPIIGAMMENATLFVGYRQVQRLIRSYTGNYDENTPLSMNQLLLAGAGSGALVSFVLTPVELIKCKLQIQQHHHDNHPQQRYRGPMHLLSHLWRQQGILGYYRGFMATMLRETFGSMFWFGAYEYTCATFLDRRRQLLVEKGRESSSSSPVLTKKDLTSVELMIGGAMGGIGYNVSMFPVDVIKSISQTDEELRKGPARSFGQIARAIYRDAGIKGFYRGCGITALRSAPTSAIIFLTYEQLTQHVEIPI
ncbi:mitochondrial carrier domain-containing protein [Absidia repens]|uniref:Mitochondrial carrier domain-containing protein n=1 Tax=Absidia repens TaxID=90262 RepID=A0A1X2II55_9FUNG|nr:mitochondrial carrier domain-containing protein [Absidia repens]